ncbi:MAG: amidohydrolase [Deltaproteobacteria bacterium]|nr:amidohydrolase [Deltaproteobacteria bacterium]
MKIFDVHMHIGDKHAWTEEAFGFLMSLGHRYEERLYDEAGNQNDCELHNILIDEGVEHAILLPEYAPKTTGIHPVERVIEIAEKYPRFIPFGFINPSLHHPTQEFERQLNLGIRGLKIHPVHCEHYVNDRNLYPLYDRCMQLNMPVMMHAGTSIFTGSKMRYADPYSYDDVATDFPDLTIILAHGGRGFWYQQAEFMVKRHKNVYIDVCGLPPQNLLKLFPALPLFPEKFLFGTDFPGVPGIRTNAEAIYGLKISLEAKELICYGNAMRVILPDRA